MIQVAFDPWLAAAAPSTCDALTSAIAAASPKVSLAISAAPVLPGALAVLLEPPALPICLTPQWVLVGPLHASDVSPCPLCLDHWLGNNLYDAEPFAPSPDFDLLDLIAQVSGTWGHRSDIIAFHRPDGRAVRQSLVARRDCPQCRGVAPASASVLRQHCSTLTGLVSAVEASAAPVAGAFRAIGMWAAPLPVAGARGLLARQRSYGRGRTAADAEAGCVGEAIERYSLIYRGDESIVRARIDEIDGLHPDAIQLFSNAQYRDRDAWNAHADDQVWVPERFDPAVAIDWLEARPLSGGAVRYVPAACCLMWYSFGHGEPEFARADTIGCAAGVTFEEALAGALLEWVERDALAVWWENRVRLPGLRLDAFGAALDDVLAGLRAMDRTLHLLDCTTDVGIPTYVAVAPKRDGSEPLVASAADLDPSRAAWRAASEVGQVWYGAQRTGGMHTAIWTWLREETVDTQPWLRPLGSIGPPSGSPVPRERTWRRVVDRLEAVGLTAYAVDQTRADVALRTVRAVVPGLRHVWNRRAPGRLYDVPVRMGWVPRPIEEAELNPVRCFL